MHTCSQYTLKFGYSLIHWLDYMIAFTEMATTEFIYFLTYACTNLYLELRSQ